MCSVLAGYRTSIEADDDRDRRQKEEEDVVQLTVSDPEEHSRVSTDCSKHRMEEGRSEVRAELEVGTNLSRVSIEERGKSANPENIVPDGVDG